MAGVLIAGLLMGYVERWLRYQRLARQHMQLSLSLLTLREVQPDGIEVYEEANNSRNYRKKSKEYAFAKWWPWISVSPQVAPEFEDAKPEP